MLASGAWKGAKRRKRHAERAEEVADLCDRLNVFKEAFEKVAKATATKKTSWYSSEDDTRPNKSPDSEQRSVVYAVQRGLRKARTVEPKKKDYLANQVCALLTKDGDAEPYTPIKPRPSPRRAPPKSVGSTASGPSGSMAGSSGRKSASKPSKAPSVSFGDDHAMDNMGLN